MLRYLFFTIFLGVLATLYTVLHLFVWSALDNLISLEGDLRRWSLWAIVVLSGGFLVALFGSHYFDSRLFRWYYYVTGAWMGFVINLVIFLGFFWGLKIVLVKFGLPVDGLVLGIAGIVLALGFFLYGLWNALEVEIKTIDINIKDLPIEWEGKSILQLSDVHLGHIHGRKILQRILEIVGQEKPDAIAITGDLFDGADGSLAEFSLLLKQLRAPLGIFYITGNHETYLGTEKAFAAIKDTEIERLGGKIQMINGLQFVGVDFPEPGEWLSPTQALTKIEGFDPLRPNVLLLHEPRETEQLAAAGIDLQLSGHTHKGQLFPLGWITHLVYKGYDFGLYQLGDYSLYVSSGAGTWGPPLRTEHNCEVVKFILHRK